MIEIIAGSLGCALLGLQIYQTGISAHNESSLASVLHWLKSLDARIDRLEQNQQRRHDGDLQHRDRT